MRSDPQTIPEWHQQRVTITVIVLACGLALLELVGQRDFSMLRIEPGFVRTQPWRFVTCALLHGGPLHLVFNMMWMSSLGKLVEPILGLWRTALAYVLIAAGSMAAEYAFWGANPVGLSGVVFGQAGMLWALSRWHPQMRSVFDDGRARFFLGWFFICIGLTYLNLLRIANVAHFAGGALGICLGWVLSKPAAERRKLAGVFPAACLGLVFLAIFGRRFVNFSGTVRDDGLGNRAITAFEDENPAAALELLERSVVLDPTSWQSAHNLGVAYSRVGRLEEALASFVRASGLAPGRTSSSGAAQELRLELAEIAIDGGDGDRGLELTEQALRANPSFADALAYRARALAVVGRMDEAVRSMRMAVNTGTSTIKGLETELKRLEARAGKN